MIQPRAAALPETPLAVFQPIEPEISQHSVCRNVFARAYAEPVGPTRRGIRKEPHALPSLDGFVLVFDTETVAHQLTFGAVELYKKRRLKTRAVFYRDDLPATDPAAYERLKEICRTLDVKLVPREWLFQYGIWPAREYGWPVTGFNLPYDFSRIADSFEPATKTGRLGSRFCNGFSFAKHFTVNRTPQTPSFVRIKRDDRHHVRYDMKNACVLDLSTLAFAHTDRNHSLASACRAFGVSFEDRPGMHSGEITLENVAGCLYDVDRTAALLWALDAEHAKHPIALHLSKAQSGASIAKAYLDALGVQPRLDVQPDFPKPYLGYAAQAYYGGRVEARIVKTPLPCVYLDNLSMYATVFALLGLWWKHLTPATVEAEEIPPGEITEQLARLRDHPDDLFDPATWKTLDFFALVEPNGANLPARAAIPSRHMSRRERIASEAAQLHEEASIAQAPFWNALDECGGKITPDILFDPKRKRWKSAGEFANLPCGILRRNSKRSPSGEVFGNIDEIAQHMRDSIGDQDLTTSDLIDFFATHERPTMDRARLEARRAVGEGDDDRPAANDAVVTIGPVESEQPLWYAAPDLAAAAIAGGAPKIIRAWRLRPDGKLDTLTPSRFRGADLIDPRTDDFFQRLIELRKAKTGDPLDDERRSTGYKVVANSGAYGIFSETSPIDIDPDDQARKPRRVAVFADTSFATEVDRPERHGRMNFFPTASLVTAGARLMLALGFYLVERAGGEVAYCDTDSLVVVASKDGGLVPCEGGPYRMRSGDRAVRALSWKAVEAIRARFQSLSPYDQSVGDVLKLEDENFTDDPVTGEKREERCNLWCYAVSEKSYALFTLDERGEPVIRKYSSHVLGQYRSPMEGDRHGWISDAWKREIRAALGKPVEPFAWEQYPAIAPLTLSTWSVLKPYRDNARVHPFDFQAVALMSRSLVDIAEHPHGCCKDPRPACTLFSSAADWKAQEWRCLRCGTPWDFDAFPRFRTYGDIVRATLQSFERKRLRADGGEPTGAAMRGLTIPRPVRVESKGTIGKEVIVDPTDTGEGLTAEQLSATSIVEYRNPGERLDALRATIKAVGISSIAKNSGISRRQIRAIVNQGATPHRSTIEKIESALRKIAAGHA